MRSGRGMPAMVSDAGRVLTMVRSGRGMLTKLGRQRMLPMARGRRGDVNLNRHRGRTASPPKPGASAPRRCATSACTAFGVLGLHGRTA